MIIIIINIINFKKYYINTLTNWNNEFTSTTYNTIYNDLFIWLQIGDSISILWSRKSITANRFIFKNIK